MNQRDIMRFFLYPAALLLTNITNAAIPINGLYSTIFGGYAYLPNNIDINQSGNTFSNASYKPGFDVGGSLGFKSNPMRYEGELTYIKANLNHFDVRNFNQIGVGGYSNATLAMANVFYDFQNVIPAIQPFLGGGIGYAWVNSNLNSTGPIGIQQYSGSNSVFAYQASTGLTFNFSENYALNLGYRYIATTTPDQLGKYFQANLANLGAIYRFDAARYK